MKISLFRFHIHVNIAHKRERNQKGNYFKKFKSRFSLAFKVAQHNKMASHFRSTIITIVHQFIEIDG